MTRASVLGLTGLVISILLGATVLTTCSERRTTSETVSAAAEPVLPPVASDPSGSESSQSRARPSVRPTPETLETARRSMSSPGVSLDEADCGPYRAVSSAPGSYLEICRALAQDLDAYYQARFGVALSHPPDGLILIVGSSDRFRAFATDFGRLRVGYAGFTLASRGVVAVLAENVPQQRFASLLAHELTHLVHRRAFGFNLAPWISEGLADALGDTATAVGFGSLSGIEGVEPLAKRLDQALEAGHTKSVAAVIARTRQSFDRGTVSYDYESSALLVRFLLLDGELSSRFRDALRKLAEADGCDTGCIFDALRVDADELDRRFRLWLGENVAGQP